MHSVFQLALRQGWCHHNPVKLADRPVVKKTETRIRFLTQPEVDALVAGEYPDTPSAVGEIIVTAAPKLASNGASKASATPKPAAPLRQTLAPRAPAPIVQRVEAEGQSGPFGVSVEIKIDAKQHTPQEIGEIVRQVREALVPTA